MQAIVSIKELKVSRSSKVANKIRHWYSLATMSEKQRGKRPETEKQYRKRTEREDREARRAAQAASAEEIELVPVMPPAWNGDVAPELGFRLDVPARGSAAPPPQSSVEIEKPTQTFTLLDIRSRPRIEPRKFSKRNISRPINARFIGLNPISQAKEWDNATSNGMPIRFPFEGGSSMSSMYAPLNSSSRTSDISRDKRCSKDRRLPARGTDTQGEDGLLDLPSTSDNVTNEEVVPSRPDVPVQRCGSRQQGAIVANSCRKRKSRTDDLLLSLREGNETAVPAPRVVPSPEPTPPRETLLHVRSMQRFSRSMYSASAYSQEGLDSKIANIESRMYREEQAAGRRDESGYDQEPERGRRSDEVAFTAFLNGRQQAYDEFSMSHSAAQEEVDDDPVAVQRLGAMIEDALLWVNSHIAKQDKEDWQGTLQTMQDDLQSCERKSPVLRAATALERLLKVMCEDDVVLERADQGLEVRNREEQHKPEMNNETREVSEESDVTKVPEALAEFKKTWPQVLQMRFAEGI